MKQLKVTHIDTGGHGYYSVSKKAILELGIQDKITGYSGHTFERVYLEEDEDGTLLYNTCKEKGIELIRRSGYNLKFNITHNYNPALFGYRPKVGDNVMIYDKKYTITLITDKRIIVTNGYGNFKISASNPFKFIQEYIS